jgi:hypothetical protein
MTGKNSAEQRAEPTVGKMAEKTVATSELTQVVEKAGRKVD